MNQNIWIEVLKLLVVLSFLKFNHECMLGHALLILQWDTTSTTTIYARRARLYDAILPGTVILPCPWTEDWLIGVPCQELQPQTHYSGTKLSGEVSNIHLYWGVWVQGPIIYQTWILQVQVKSTGSSTSLLLKTRHYIHYIKEYLLKKTFSNNSWKVITAHTEKQIKQGFSLHLLSFHWHPWKRI